MILQFGIIEFTVGLLSVSSSYDSGVEWKERGGVYKAIDRGADSSHHTSSILISANVAYLSEIRRLIESYQRTGQKMSIMPEPGETLFGPHVAVSVFYTGVAECGAEETNVEDETFYLGKLSITFILDGSVQDHYTEDGYILPATLAVKSLERSGNPAGAVNLLESGVDIQGLGHEAPTVEVELEGSAFDVAYGLVFLEKRRALSFAWPLANSAKSYLFSPGEAANQACYVLEVEYLGRVDRAANFERMRVTLAKAV